VKQDSFAADRLLIHALEKRSQPVPCFETCILFNQGDPPSGLFILKSGEAALTVESTSGRIVMCLHAGAGSLLGLPGIVGNEPYTMTALARKGSEVRFVTRDDFEELIRTEPSLYPTVLKVLAAEVREARHSLSSF
jgi:CRP-like cAMP-binding protein